MEKIKKWRRFALALLSLLFVAIFSFALVQIIPAGAEETYDADGDLVCDGNTADYTIEADNNFTYDAETNTWASSSANGARLYDAQFTLTVTKGGNIQFQYTGSSAGGKNLSIYKTSTDGDPIFSKNYSSSVQSEETDLYTLVTDNKGKVPFIVTLLNVNEGVYIFQAKCFAQNYNLSGFKKATTNYNVSATIAGEVHGTVSIGDNTLNTDTVTGSTQVEMGKTITLTASPEVGYFAFWQDAAGKVVCRENAFTTPAVQGDTGYTVRFEKIGANGLKIYYPSKVGEDSQTSSGWIKDVADEVTTYKVGIPALTKAQFTTTLEFTFEGAGVLDFDYHFYRNEMGSYKPEPEASLKVDGKEYERMPKLDYTYTDHTTSRDETNADQWKHATLYISGEGSHTVTLEYSLDYSNRSAATGYAAFSVKKAELSSPAAHTFTLDYDEKLGEITVLGAVKGGGNTYTGYDGFPITLTANTTNVISSLDSETSVPTHFIHWTLGEEIIAEPTLNVMFENGQLKYNEVALSEAKIQALFEEETIRPIVFRQISNPEVETARTTNGEEVQISIEAAAETQLRILTAGFGEEKETVSLKVNGVETSLQSISRNDDFGGLLTEEMLEAFSQDEQEINWWLQTALGEQLVLEVSYSCEGYFGTSTLKAYITYTAEKKQPGSFNNALNNLFTEDSEEGASVDCNSERGEGETAWSATNKWESEGGSVIFENNQKQANLGNRSPGITSGEGSNLWYYTFLRIQIGQDGGQLRKGVLMFDLYFEMTEGNGDRNGAVVVERRDNGYSNAPDGYQGNDVDYMPEHGLGGQEGLFNSACITSVLEHTNDTHVWGMSSNTYVTDLGGGWYRCVFPTVRESKYPGENGSTTHDTRQFLITFGYMSGTSPRYAIRNVTFRNGQDANFQFEANDTAYNSDVTATAGGEEVTIGTPKQVGFGSTVELKATAPQGKKFYGWEVKDSNGKSTYYASTDVKGGVYTLKYTVLDPVTIVAWFGEESEFTARIGGHFYHTLDESITKAKELGTAEIIVVRDGITLNESLEIPKGISLILPFSEEGGYFGSAASGKYATDSRIAWADSGLQQKNRFLTFTIESGVTLTVKGRLYVGGVMNHTEHNYQGHTSGAYAEIINNGSIIIEDGGMMDVYGRVTGAGSIEVKSGAELKEPFLILDFEGGTETLGLFMDGLTPFKRYAMINIECEFTVRYGARLVGHATLYALNQYVSLDQAFIGAADDYGRDTMIMLKPNAYVTVNYNAGKVVQGATPKNGTEGIGETTMNFHGGATFSYMQFTAMGITVPTSGVYFSIPYNFNLQLDGNGIYETKTDFMVMPGAVVHVCAGSKLILHANTWILDGLKQGTLIDKSYPAAEDLSAVGYSKNGNLIVDGTLEIQQKYGLDNHTALPVESNLKPAVFVGIVQTTGTSGKIIIANDAILKWTVVDGRENKNYFAYTTTARVWDKVHNCFGELVAGHTYTATSGDDFTLNELKYTNTANDAETETLALSSNMVGTWKVDHEENHNYDWTPVESDKLADGELFKKIDRTCTELGCDHKEEKYLFSAAADLGSLTFRGSEFKESDLVELFKKYFTKDALDSFPEEIKVTASGFGVAKDVNEAGYSVTITLDKGVWLKDGVYVGSETFHWSITRLSLEGGIGTATPTQSTTTYNGKEQKLGVTVTVDGIDGNLQSGTDYEIVSYKGDVVNVSEKGVTITIMGKGNYSGTITCTYQIVAKKVNLKLTKQSTAYSGTKPKVDSTQYTTDDIFEGDEDNVTITIDFATKEGVTWKVGQYTLTASLKNTNGHENYVLGSVENNTNAFEITKKAVTVTVQAQHKTYNGGAQSYDAEWTADGLVNEEQNSVLGVQLSATGTDANSYDVTATYDESGNYTVTFAGADELQTAGNTIKSAFVIDRLNIEGADIQVAACTYNGKAQQPTLTVTKDGLTVTYTAEYSNNTNAGDASVEVTGNGNFTGTASTTFTIERAKVTITPERKISPKGQDLLELTVSFSGFCGDDESKFLKGTDYTVTTDATKDKEPGDYDITVELLTEEKWTNYTFEVKEGKGFYQITAEVFANVKFEGANSAEYDGETHSYTVTLGDPGGDTEGTFETPTYTYKKNGSTVVEAMKDVGTYTVEAHITFKESKEGGRTYETTITATFTITAKDIRDAVIELENTTLTYAHKELQPKVINVTVGTLTLTEQEYEVSYSANTNVGEATVTVTASGNFTGTATTNFTITARSLEGAQITVKQGSETLTYNGNAQKPDVTVTLEIDGDTVTLGANDYTADYTSNTNVGKATVTVTGKGNYQESAVNAEAFTIKAKAVNVTILAQSVVYAGLNTAPTLGQGAEKWTAQQGAICGSDDLQITLKAVENEDHLWSARTYEIDGVSANENYSVTFTKGTLTIQKRAITVTIADKSSEYGETYATPTWSTQDELGAGDNDEALGITLAIAGAENKLAVGTYKISGQASNANYAVTFAGNWDAQTGETDGGVYTVEKRKVTIEIIGQSDIYNNEEFEVPQEENEGWKVTAGSILEGDDLHIVLTKAAGKTVTPEGYAITGKYTEGNYEVTWVNGVYMIEKRPVTVKIANQSGAVYHYKHNYALDGTKWEVLTDAGKGLASGEEKSVLHVTLKTDTMSDAGDYPISGEWANDNYEVTFVGDYEKTETQSGHAGIYTIAKADVTNEATFMMAVKTENGDPVHSTSEGSDGLRVAYEGKTLVLVCHASIDEDEGDTRDLEVTIDPETLNIEGEYEVKITIVDKNYMGTAKYKVVVTDAKGYTPKLKETLAKLQELVEGLDADALTAEDFDAVKAIYDAMQGLDDAEREVGADDLAAYEELVESWNSMTEIDAVIETAESIADSAIGWLAQTSAVLTALAGVAYIGKKGGLLK